MNTTNGERYPLDFDLIRKGDAWTSTEIAEMLGVQVDTQEYAFAALRLRHQIEVECKFRNYPVTVAVVRGVLRVLTDSEAVEYNARQFEKGIRSSGRAFGRQQRVDVRQLTTEERVANERSLLLAGAQLLALRNAKRDELKRQKAEELPPPKDEE